MTFDVSLSVSDAKEGSSGATGKAGSKLKVFVVDADVSVDGHAARKRTRSEEATHRVSFAIPILLSAHHRADPSMGLEAELIGQIDEAWFGKAQIE
ncbi:hypothetical protein [Brevundimonas viscosa]|uniref:hypothetical protein n=1 Tax=Brevundimonas viscosa TaxID=871741 RepID=UPI00116047AC|nr:hypothetical protein [Brevundimonas viscosa]